MLRFSFRQTLTGTYWLLSAPADERAMGFTIDARTHDVRVFARDKTMRVSGTIEAEGLASGRPLEGCLAVKLIDERRVGFRVAFEGDDGRRYELSGQEEWTPLSPVGSLTRLEATLYDDADEEIGRVVLRFDVWSEWKRWLKSFRLAWA
jgi:hypothetical protein